MRGAVKADEDEEEAMHDTSEAREEPALTGYQIEAREKLEERFRNKRIVIVGGSTFTEEEIQEAKESLSRALRVSGVMIVHAGIMVERVIDEPLMLEELMPIEPPEAYRCYIRPYEAEPHIKRMPYVRDDRKAWQTCHGPARRRGMPR